MITKNKESRKLTWKKLIVSSALIAAASLAVTGCGSKSDKNNDSDKSAESGVLADQVAEPQKGDQIAVFHIKDYGDIKVRFFEKAAPKAVENFVTHAEKGYFNGQIFHRVINDFMIQGGDPTGTGTGGDSIWGGTFEDECVDYLMPIRGALCMANRGADTNQSQFFIVQAKTATINSSTTLGMSDEQVQFFKDHGGYPSLAGGYTVFGQVVEGMDVVDKIAATKTDSNDKPLTNVTIENIEITTY